MTFFSILVVFMLSTTALGSGVCNNPAWKTSGNRCYRFYSQDGLSYAQMQSQCKRAGGELARIDNAKQDALAMKLAGNSRAFIGLTDRIKEGQFKWSDGSAPTYTNWAPGEPNDSKTVSGEDCVVINWKGDKWNDVKCSSNQWSEGFVCSSDVVPANPCADAAWKSEGDRCYRFYPQDGLNYPQMQANCKRAGGELARIDNAKQDALVHLLAGKSRAFIGLTDRIKEGHFKWSDGTTPSFTNWAPGEPNDDKTIDGEDCVVVNWKGDKWNDVKCVSNTASEGYVCSANVVPTNPCATSDWKTEGSRCYRFYAQDGLSYPQMQANCKRVGGQLARIDNAKQDALAMKLAGKSRAFIGLTDKIKEGQFKWADGTSPAYSNWAPGEPNDSKTVGGEDCVVLNWKGDKWNDVKCVSNTASEGYVCSADVVPKNPCDDAAWKTEGDRCYRFYAQDGLNYPQMQATCKRAGGELARIDNARQDALVHTLVGKSRAFIGLTDRIQEGKFKWADGTTPRFTNWAPGEPNDAKTVKGEDCVVINWKGDKWNDVKCNSNQWSEGFVCSAKAVPIDPCSTKAWKTSGNRCYRFFSQDGLSYPDMQLKCKRVGGYLARIDNAKQDALAMRLAGKSRAFIGLTDSIKEGQFKWTDGTTPRYSNWAPGEPNDSKTVDGEDCVVLNWKGDKWNDVKCTSNQWSEGFVCSADVIPTTPCQSRAWKTSGNRCYRFYSKDGLNYPQMQAKCKRVGGQLARIDNARQEKVASSLAGKSRAFIGLQDRIQEGQFKWSDGTTPSYSNWSPGEPNDDKTIGGEDCVVLNWKGDKWNDVKCNENQFSEGFLCSAQVVPKRPCRDAAWTTEGDRCYRYYGEDGLSYPQMQANCKRVGGELARIDNLKQDAIVRLLVGTSRAFIGLNDRTKEGQFTWSDGTSPVYTDWSPGEPNDYFGKEDCVVVNWGGSKWNDVKCVSNDASEGYVCSAKVIPPPPAPLRVCDSYAWKTEGKRCYRFFPTDGLSYTQMQRGCKRVGGSLARIDNAKQDALVQFLAGKSRAFIGLTDRVTEGKFTWSDGSHPVYTNWSPGEPNDFKKLGGEDCVVVNWKGNKWNDVKCVSNVYSEGYVCSAEVSSPLPAPCNDPEWTLGGNRCYRFYNKDGLSYPQMRATCQQAGGDLARIDNTQQDALAQFLAGKSRAFIGLTDRVTEGQFTWTDGTSPVYTNWSPGEPNDYLGGEDCTVINWHGTSWNDVKCTSNDVSEGFVCSAEAPRPVLRHVCDSKDWKTEGNRCYRFFAQDGLSYAQMQVQCNEAGGELARFDNAKQDKVARALVGKSRAVIGLTDRTKEGKFKWSDGTTPRYTNWAPGEPNDSKTVGGEDCVVMNWYGDKWNDVKCDSSQWSEGFVCSATINAHPTGLVKLSGGNDILAKNLKACTGECDSDSQCVYGLKCFQRQHGEPIPGCYGKGGGPHWDYCYDPSRKGLLSGTNDPKAKNLSACHGECDADSQCIQGLKCFQRSHGEAIPGCFGKGGGPFWDYCYNPSLPITLSGINDAKAKNLKACTGECDADSQCAYGLKCFQRSHGERIPGCTGKGGGPLWDYCYDPLLPIVLSGTNDNKAKNLRRCTGECDADSQCASGLKCFQRAHGEPIPGCTGKGGGPNWDYCYNPYTLSKAKRAAAAQLFHKLDANHDNHLSRGAVYSALSQLDKNLTEDQLSYGAGLNQNTDLKSFLDVYSRLELDKCDAAAKAACAGLNRKTCSGRSSFCGGCASGFKLSKFNQYCILDLGGDGTVVVHG